MTPTATLITDGGYLTPGDAEILAQVSNELRGTPHSRAVLPDAPCCPEPSLRDEPARAQALASYSILDTPKEPVFDDIAELAAEVCEAPIAVVNFLATDRQWFKAETGIGTRELPLDVSICRYALLQPGLFVVPDLACDPRFEQNPLVTAAGGLRFYAGALIETPEGLPLGTVCVLDSKPRPAGLAERQGRVLRSLARQVMSELELRRAIAERDAEAAKRNAERERLWRLSADAMVVTHSDASIIAANPAWTALLGWDDQELIGRSFLDFIHPDDLSRTVAETGRLSSGLTTSRFENRYRHKDGSYRWLSWTAVPEGGFIHGVARDVTEEKARERELEAAREQLRQAQKLEAVGQLTGGVAHDFNNLLTIIRGSVELLMRPGVTDERRARYIQAIADTTTRATKLTNQLLAFARRQALRPEVFDVGESVLAVSDMVGTLMGGRIRLETHVPDSSLYVDADPSQFDTAIINMAVNARDAMEGEGTLTITVEAVAALPAVRAAPGVAGDYVAVSLSDTGPGISPEICEQIFEPFFTTKGVGQGTGLGLSQVYGFTKQSGGEVTVESEPDRGSTFTIYLPRADKADRAPEPVLAEPLIDGQGSCVLVVEDNAEVGEFAKHTLSELGFATILAPHADAALQELDRDPTRFDVVFSDVMMPGMNGVELGQEIRRRFPDVPIVLASGYSHEIAKHGTHGFELLHKPYSIEALSRVLHRMVRWRLRDGLRRPPAPGETQLR